MAFYEAVRTYREFFAFHGFEREAEEIQRCFREGDELGMINAVPDEMVHSLMLAGTPDDAVPDEMVDSLMLAGTPDDVRQRLARWEGLPTW